MQGWVIEILGFNHHMIRWCSLHTLNLGPVIWSLAACFIIGMLHVPRLDYIEHPEKKPEPQNTEPYLARNPFRIGGLATPKPSNSEMHSSTSSSGAAAERFRTLTWFGLIKIRISAFLDLGLSFFLGGSRDEALSACLCAEDVAETEWRTGVRG